MKFRIIETERKLLVEEITQSNLEKLYDVEYRYNRIKNSGFNGVPQRYDNILKLTKGLGDRIADHIISELLEVFEDWFKMHNIDDPKEMAKDRVDDMIKLYGDEFLDMINGMSTEYGSNMLDDYINYIDENKIKDNALEKFKEVITREYLDFVIEDVEAGYMEQSDYDELEKQYNEGDYSSTPIDSSSIENGVKLGYINDIDLYNEIYLYLIYPKWIKRFGHISSTVNEIKYIIDDLKSSNTLEEKFKNINIALNAVHSSGPMLDYISQNSPDITEGLLDYLSEDFDTESIDDELRRQGFKI